MSVPTAKEIAWFRQKLIVWFRTNKRPFLWRDESAGDYIKVLSEVLLQRTRAEVVAAFLTDFLKRYPSWDELSKATEEDLQQYLQPLGLWRRRAASLKRLADEMAKRKGRFPRSRAEIEQLPNVGQYIANAILLFCHGESQPLLDVNMARVLERFFGPRKLADIRYDPYLQSLAKAVVSSMTPELVNWAILDHATLICKISVPLCMKCPVVTRCQFANTKKPAGNSPINPS